MKPIIKKTWMLIAMLCASLSTYAYDFEVDGIYYNVISLSEMTCAVTSGENKYQGDIIIPAEITFNSRKVSVIQIGSKAFMDCSTLVSVTIPDSVTAIGESAFFGCNSLTSITIPNSVTAIGKSAFYGCSSLTSVTLPNSLKIIEEYTFCRCDISTLTLPQSVDCIKDNAFEYNPIEEMVIPKNIIYIGNLGSMLSLRKLEFEDTENPIEIEFDYFIDSPMEELYVGRPITMNCTRGHWINGVFIMDSYTACLGRSAFCRLKSLKKVILGEYCNQITPQWFYECSKLEQLIIQDGENPIEFFQNIYYDKKRQNTYPQYITQYKYVATFASCPLKDVYIGRNIIYKQKFNGVSYENERPSPFGNKSTLNKVVIGNHVTNLPAKSFFENDNIHSLEIGELLLDIPSRSFAGNNEIESIVLKSEYPPTYSTPFTNSIYVNTSLYVPQTSIDLYQLADPWKNFWNLAPINGINDIENDIDSDAPIRIYTINGMEIRDKDFLPAGIYIMRQGSKTKKIAVGR